MVELKRKGCIHTFEMQEEFESGTYKTVKAIIRPRLGLLAGERHELVPFSGRDGEAETQGLHSNLRLIEYQPGR
jgi:hypothetical protein